MPDILTNANQKHVLITPATCRCNKLSDYPCPVCEGGLAVCSLCGAAEVELDGPCVPSRPYKGNGLPDAKNAVERDSGSSSPIPVGSASPETIRISLPVLRAVLFEIMDSGDPYLYQLFISVEDKAMAARIKLADRLCDRLRQLPARG